MKEHKILDKNIIFGTILLLIIGTLVSNFVGMFGFGNQLATRFLAAVGGFVALLVFKRIFKGEFLGFIKGADNKVGFRAASFVLIYYAFLMFQTLVFGKYAFPGLLGLATACTAGVVEEVLFRGYMVSYLFRHKNNEKSIPWILTASAVVFGLSHAMNLFSGAGIAITMMQVIGTIGIGALLAAIYMRSGNILIVMIAHGLTDFIAFMDSTQMSAGGIMTTETLTFTNYLDGILCICLFAIGLYLIRPAKREEIVSLWNKKWLRQQ